MRTRLKICGITRQEQALEIADLGVHALGFIFYPKSKRYINISQAQKIIKHLPVWMTTVGVFVNEDLDTIQRTVYETGIDLVQLHGDESLDLCHNLTKYNMKWMKAIRVKNAVNIETINKIPNNNILFDTFHHQEFGGTGQTFDWNVLKHIQLKKHIYLAGGIDEHNIQQALQKIHPSGIDISSSVEISPGNKSITKIKSFIKIFNKI